MELNRTFSLVQVHHPLCTNVVHLLSWFQECNLKILTKGYRMPLVLHNLFPTVSSRCWKCQEGWGTTHLLVLPKAITLLEEGMLNFPKMYRLHPSGGPGSFSPTQVWYPRENIQNIRSYITSLAPPNQVSHCDEKTHAHSLFFTCSHVHILFIFFTCSYFWMRVKLCFSFFLNEQV